MKIFNPAASIILIAMLAMPATTKAQQQLEYIFRVTLNDKGQTGYSIEKPNEFLSEKAVARKTRQQAPIDSTDLPISDDYLRSIELNGGQIVAKSKWLNTLAVKLTDSAMIANIAELPFVKSTQYVWRGRQYVRNDARPRLEMPDCDQIKDNNNPYGIAREQFEVHNALTLLNSGFAGKGISIAVIDAGFTNVDVIPLFDKANIVGTANFVPSGQLYAANDHGTKVLSTMCTNQPGIMLGSAHEASYTLLLSEDVRSEFPVEEDYWISAIEYADSIGIDLVNTSLGYNYFDDPTLSYNHSQLTGQISPMSRAANMAVEKGMIVVCCAGNEGRKRWRKIIPPGDAVNVLAVGAIGTDSIIASFSSAGPTADLRIKPDIVSIGRDTYTIDSFGTIDTTNGTSLSAPFVAGLIASLWSINPELNRKELIDIVKRSSDRYQTPDTIYGYGIPNFGKAMRETLLTLPANNKRLQNNICSIYLQNGNYSVTLNSPLMPASTFSAKLLDESGSLLQSEQFGSAQTITFNTKQLDNSHSKQLFFVLQSPLEQYTYRIER